MEEEIISHERLETEYADLYQILIREGKRPTIGKRKGNTIEVSLPCYDVFILFEKHEFYEQDREGRWFPKYMPDYYTAYVKFGVQNVTISADSLSGLLHKLAKVLEIIRE
jgi:hypothetical protein